MKACFIRIDRGERSPLRGCTKFVLDVEATVLGGEPSMNYMNKGKNKHLMSPYQRKVNDGNRQFNLKGILVQ